MNKFSEITSAVQILADKRKKIGKINPDLYDKYEVKRGLRYKSGRGVLTGLTEIGEVKSYTIDDGEMIPCEGKLYYHGVDIEQIVAGFTKDERFGFEEVVYLLLFGEQPNQKQLDDFKAVIAEYRTLPTSFVRDIIMKAPSSDMMNTLARSVLTLYSYDEKADDTSVENVLRQSLELIALFPLLSVYGYQACNHYLKGHSLFIHTPPAELSTAETILYTLRPDNQFTPLEAKLLDICLVVQAEHGGGNNSTFTTHVVSSSGTDTYSSVAASLGSLKGPKHGGANKKVVEMFHDIQENVKNWEDEEEVRAYLEKILSKQAFDKSGLIYGIGHAVYSLSDPRTTILKKYVGKLAEEKGMQREMALYEMVERIAPELLKEKRNRPVSANVDFYSGFVYSMLGLPLELYTPIFAIARIAGWSAHRIEEIVNSSKIIRPAYKNVIKHTPYIPMEERE
ncbi:MAG: citrate/2-methylcitrate synthase [Ruminococcaceae bacterium]|nr:citrate/2-methylcitrate synthase [Oscillospiraceae bacterium]